MGHSAGASRRSQLTEGGRNAVMRLLRLLVLVLLVLVLMMMMRVLLLLLLLLFELRRRRRRRRCQEVAIFDRRRSASPSSASAHSASSATAAAILLSHYVAAPFRSGVLEPNLVGPPFTNQIRLGKKKNQGTSNPPQPAYRRSASVLQRNNNTMFLMLSSRI